MFGEYKFNILLPSQYHPLVGLYPTWVGYLTALQNYECKPRVLDDFFIIFVSSGKGIFRCKGNEYRLDKHDAFFLFPGIVHYYATDPNNLLELWWIGFNGPNAQKILHDLGVSPESCLIKGMDNPETLKTIKEIVNSVMSVSSGTALKSSGCLYKLFGQLLDLYMPEKDKSGSSEHFKFFKPVERALAFIDANYPHDISIRQIASYAGLSRTHFATRFKSEVGCSPSEHLAKMRLKQAIHYLCNSDLSIMEVAHSSGFLDPQYFSRFFKNHKGMSPVQYRLIHTNKPASDKSASKTSI